MRSEKKRINRLGFCLFKVIFLTFLPWYITMEKAHHLREYFWNFFQASPKQIEAEESSCFFPR